jgi:ribosomal protein S3
MNLVDTRSAGACYVYAYFHGEVIIIVYIDLEKKKIPMSGVGVEPTHSHLRVLLYHQAREGRVAGRKGTSTQALVLGAHLYFNTLLWNTPGNH